MKIKKKDDNWLCRDCAEINKTYYTINTGRRICGECGGTVLSLQEAADHILELKDEIRSYKERYEE